MLKPPKGFSNERVSLLKVMLQWLANCSIKNSSFRNYMVNFALFKACTGKAVANGLVGQVLAGSLFLKVKTKFSVFYKKQIINKSTIDLFSMIYSR